MSPWDERMVSHRDLWKRRLWQFNLPTGATSTLSQCSTASPHILARILPRIAAVRQKIILEAFAHVRDLIGAFIGYIMPFPWIIHQII